MLELALLLKHHGEVELVNPPGRPAWSARRDADDLRLLAGLDEPALETARSTA